MRADGDATYNFAWWDDLDWTLRSVRGTTT